MKKLTSTVLAVVLSSSFGLVSAQKTKQDSSKTTDIQEVVVTALGIKREKKSLGYASQEVKGDLISEAGQVNAVSALSGNVAGVQVNAPSTMGGSTRITVRGISSITGENRPLIIVDGIPLDNTNVNSTDTQRGGGGRDYGDASFDINPDDIESVTVLKGGPASALYGSRASNGVIIYTTKSAKRGRTTIDLNTGVSFESIYIYPNLQREYGGGSSDQFEQITIAGKKYNIADYSTDESWGPKYNPNLMYLPWYAFDTEFKNDYMKEVPWVAPANDVDKFFQTGVTYTNNIAVSKSFENTNVRFSYTNTNISGILPSSGIDKNNFSFNATTKLSDKLKASTVINYVNTSASNRPDTGYGDDSFGVKFFQWGQRQLDYAKLRDYKLADGSQRAWNRSAWNDSTPAYHDNPYWTLYENWTKDQRSRVYGTINLTYNFTKNLYLVANVMGDNYTLSQQSVVAVGSQAQSSYRTSKRTVSEYNYEARLHYDNKFGDFNLTSFVGVNRRQNKVALITGASVGGLIIPNYYNLSNSRENALATNAENQKRVNSLYGQISLGYKDFLYLEATGRNDWFSTVTTDSFYPSATLSFIFSSIIKAPWLSFGKLRLGWANIGNDTNPYQTVDYADALIPFLGDPRYSLNPTKANTNLKPERKTTKEIGLEMSFLKNRIGFDATYYDVKIRDLILPLEIDYSTGFRYTVINGGLMTNKGVELNVYGTPIKTPNFSWNINVNFAKNVNKVEELDFGAQNYLYTNAPFRAQLYATVGQPYGTIYGTNFVYDANGNKVVGSDGLYKATGIENLGSILPDYNMGIRNSFKYKNISLSALIDIQKGGKYFSTSHMWGMYSGMIEESALNGNREGGVVLEGVKEDGTINDQRISAVDWGKSYYNTVDAQNVFDASYIKLRDITLSYDLPKDFLQGTSLTGVRISAFARNLFAWNLDWKGMDPENTSYGSGNIQGLEGGSLPSTRQYGVNLSFKF
ncbi:SusC/RagA family TonB-linked outer membrane protein [Elizabethkingia sp. JS20170427COW]|uniref:SusC/RagA family TonB-linked outer membrane protein n=1 Tax=Elizabethkingia sp. JS20170427COW TaxID=2583851 RepID=UPI00111025D8|nr:SusC/RagA family TonB-linked outer membrane protein [Elizabethkingia sp. JS20170427COW]QCX52609.1 SusC/RagA family TonB-linked outer membrane protein [Elizabethkingia sp. JS20170427COW]